MTNRITKYFVKRVLASKQLMLCPLCDDAVIPNDNERACYHCTLDASWGVTA